MLFFGSSEQEILDLIQKHTLKVEACLNEFFKFVRDYLALEIQFKEKVLAERDRYKEGSFKVHTFEAEADALRREIFTRLSGGSFLPHTREDLAHLVKNVDKIANKAENTGDFIMLEAPHVPEKYHPELSELLDLVARSFQHFKVESEHFFTDLDKVAGETEQVIKIKEDSDRIEWHILKKVFMDENLDLARKIHLRDLVKSILNIGNVIEDAADQVKLVAIRRKI